MEGKLARVQMWPPYESVVFTLVALNAEQSRKPPRGTVGGEDAASIYKNCDNRFSLKEKFTQKLKERRVKSCIPQNISGASLQTSIAAFSLTAEVDGDQ